MSVEENKAIVDRWNKGYHAGNWEVFDKYLAEDYSVGGMSREEHKQRSIAGHGGLSDNSFEVHDVIAEGDKVVIRWTIRGTHTGTWFGIPPTNKTVSFTGINIYQLRDGEIVQEWASVDRLGVMQQLGLLPEVG